MRYDDVLGLIGDTPLVGVHALSPNPDVRIWAKLEGQNPGGSSKDRIALQDDRARRSRRRLAPGDDDPRTVVGQHGHRPRDRWRKLRGYSLRVVMPENVSVERRQLLEIFGAEIVLSPGEEGSNGAIRMAEKIAADDPSLRAAVPVRQSREPARALRGHRAGDLARLPRGRRVRRRPRYERHADGRRAVT